MAAWRTSYREILTRPANQGQEQGATVQDPGLSILRTALDLAHFDRGPVHPFQRDARESLPRGTFRNHQGLLVRGTASFTLDVDSQATVAQEIPFLSAHVVLACVVEGDIQGVSTDSWWESLRELAAPGKVNFHRRVGHHFAYVRTDGQPTTNRLLTRGFHSFNGGTVIYQRWIKGFNSRIPISIRWPM